MKKIRRPIVKELLLQTLNEAKHGKFDNNAFIIGRPYQYDKDFDISYPAVPWVPGMYIRFSTKPQYRPIYEGIKHLKYPTPRKYSDIENTLLNNFNFATPFDVSAGVINKNGIASQILIISKRLFLSTSKAMFTDFMEKCGYHYSLSLRVQKDGISQFAMQFEPYLYRSNDFKIPKMLYHITPAINKDSILKNGIQVSWPKTPVFEYPERAYFFTTLDGIRFKRFVKSSDQFIGDMVTGVINFTVLEIDPLKTDTNFYSDPNMPDAVYCYDDIPADAIIRVIDDSTTR